jgi:hypothetical protein
MLFGLLAEWELLRSLGHPSRVCLTVAQPPIFFIVCHLARMLQQLKCLKLQTAKAEFTCMFTRLMKKIAFSQTMSFQQ